VHISVSVGWLGAAAAYLVLDLTGAASRDVQTLRGAWVAMGSITSLVLVPLSLLSLLTGIVISMGTKWGLFRHWWVVISLMLTIAALLVLLSETGYIRHAAAIAADPAAPAEAILALPGTLPHSIGGIVVLLVIQTLNVYKPRGLTAYGWRMRQQGRPRR
jgi:hypothetical protein